MASITHRGANEVIDVPAEWAFGYSPDRPDPGSRPGSTFSQSVPLVRRPSPASTLEETELGTGCHMWTDGFDVVVEGDAVAVSDDAVVTGSPHRGP